MGTRYRAEVFFGVVAERESELEKRLLFFIESAGGCMPAQTSVKGVEVSEVGSWPLGETHVVARATGSAVSFGQGEDAGEPKALVEDSAWRDRISNLFAHLGVEEQAPGWFFASVVT